MFFNIPLSPVIHDFTEIISFKCLEGDVLVRHFWVEMGELKFKVYNR